MWRDLRFGFRQLTRNRLLSISIVLMLAVGIGANTMIFSFIESLLLKPLPVRNPQSLFLLEKNREKQVKPDAGFYYRQYDEVSARKDLFSSAIAEQNWESSSFVPFDQNGTVRMISALIVSPNYFTELGVHAILGRALAPSDAALTSKIPVVISYQFWQSQFNKNPDAVGRTIRLKKTLFLIVGVLPEEFHSIDIDRAPDVRLPISAARAITGDDLWNPQGISAPPITFNILARPLPGVSPRAAASAILSQMRLTDRNIWRGIYAHFPAAMYKAMESRIPQLLEFRSDYRIALRPAAHGISYMRSQFATTLLLLMGGVGLLLLAICANVSGLLLAEAAERRREIAVRLSIGASPGRLARQLFTENLLVAVPGAVLGIALAYVLSPVLIDLVPGIRGWVLYKATKQIIDITPDERALLFTLAVSLISIFVFGTMPAFRAARLNIDAELKGSSRGTTQVSSGLFPVAIQVALSTILVVGSVLMLKTFWNLEHLNPGFDRAHIVEFTLDPKAVGYSPQQTSTFFRELLTRVSALPGVRSDALADEGIMLGRGLGMTITPQGVVLPPKTFLNTSANAVSTGYFETMGIPLLRGRTLQEGDLKRKPQPVVVNKAFADFFFPHQDPIGKMFVSGTDGTKPPNNVIVGLAGTAKYRSMQEKDTPTLYGLLREGNGGILYIRTFGNPAAIIGEVRKVLRDLDPKVPLVEVSTLEQEVQNSLWQERLVTLLSVFFGIVSLFLAAAGLYGALAYSVARRTREMGIRLALGAAPRHILQTVSARMMTAVLIGLAAGLLFAALLTGLLRKLLYGVQPLDPAAFLVTAGCVLLCAAIATAFPVLRAIQTDPASALRAE